MTIEYQWARSSGVYHKDCVGCTCTGGVLFDTYPANFADMIDELDAVALQRCDSCQRFASDLEATHTLATALSLPVGSVRVLINKSAVPYVVVEQDLHGALTEVHDAAADYIGLADYPRYKDVCSYCRQEGQKPHTATCLYGLAKQRLQTVLAKNRPITFQITVPPSSENANGD